MKNFLRKIFASKVLCFILMFLEFAAVVVLWAFVELRFVDYAAHGTPPHERALVDLIITIVFYALRAVLYVIDLLVFFKIIIRDENPEYKIPWLALMFLLPIWTIVFYLVFVRNGIRKRDRKIVEPTKEILLKYQDETEEEHNSLLAKIDPRYQGIFNYLRKATHLGLTEGNRMTYYRVGEDFFPEFVESLKKAEKFIFIEFFIIGEGIWWTKVLDVLKEKATQGVDVRVIYDDIGSSGVVKSNMPDKLQKMGIKCHKFHPVMPTMSNTVNNRDHRKIVVVDHKLAFTGGMNLADEYANDEVKFGYWKDTMVKIEGPGIANLIATFLQNYDLTTFQISNYDEFLKGDYPKFNDKGMAFAFGDAPGAFNDHENIGEQNYINLLNVAVNRVDISTPYLICSYPMMRALMGAAKRGVEVNLFVPGVPDKKFVYYMAKSSFHVLLEAGVNIYVYKPGFNHEKQMLVDDRVCFTGTINFDFRSLTHHFECGVTYIDVPCLKEIKADFEDMMTVSEKVPSDFKMKGWSRFLAGILKMFRVLFQEQKNNKKGDSASPFLLLIIFFFVFRNAL